ncbi:alpha/beta hydrolase [Campylobacter sp. MIT 21-1685]|uniref:alpha/beta fold hydrolase n=1 Tax=unclassified Campylobacter TaxID=2593542 RepID=UPI00224B1497|nr:MULTISPECIES: alpha/beta hydrolase [unclassified Campylobacter]MCX2683601.1 alpha/beta hydrolase [Campylobacter sp. MIT 21-1684]MCX2751884.1 alpha/beta hydrolase [Campylobacter sp. MIT 21-1682]MCX2808063.1 alpha/beta hydrolase [Campylobacter sp. MIT 21-1685]
MAQANIKYKEKNYTLSYELQNTTKPEILLLHGWGANKELMKQAFEKVFNNFSQIYLDLPGFGNSSIEEPLTSDDYADIVYEFLQTKNFYPQIILGHSFGGKIAALLIQKLRQTTKLVLLSNSGILAKKTLKVRLKITLFKIVKHFGLGKLYRLFASEDAKNLNPLMYKTFKNVVDEDLSARFAKITNKTFIFWGMKDKATPLESGEKMHKLIVQSEFYPLEGDHFFFFKYSDFIASKLQGYK